MLMRSEFAERVCVDDGKCWSPRGSRRTARRLESTEAGTKLVKSTGEFAAQEERRAARKQSANQLHRKCVLFFFFFLQPHGNNNPQEPRRPLQTAGQV